jgi:XcyI restriction endonuclease
MKPDLQISLYSWLQALRERYLIESLKKTAESEDFDLKTLDAELATYADAKNLRRIASFGLRGEIFFPVPYVIARNPFLLGYYRLLLGFSRKAFYEQGPFKSFHNLEDRGKISEALQSSLPALCLNMSASASMLVDWINPTAIGVVHELQLMTLGAQFRGSGNVRVGQDAIDQFFNLLSVLVEPYNPTIKGRKMSLKNDSKLPVEVRFASDPDVSITQQLKSQQRKLVAIELKGGTDISNVWNRLGEAEKSHQSARHAGFNEFVDRPAGRCCQRPDDAEEGP